MGFQAKGREKARRNAMLIFLKLCATRCVEATSARQFTYSVQMVGIPSHSSARSTGRASGGA